MGLGGTGRGGRGVAGDGDGRGPNDRLVDMPVLFRRGGGSLLPPVVDRCGPVDGNGSDRGDKWQSNRSQSVIF